MASNHVGEERVGCDSIPSGGSLRESPVEMTPFLAEVFCHRA